MAAGEVAANHLHVRGGKSGHACSAPYCAFASRYQALPGNCATARLRLSLGKTGVPHEIVDGWNRGGSALGLTHKKRGRASR